MDITSGLRAPVNQNNQILNGGALGMITMARTSQSTAQRDFTGRYMRELSDKVLVLGKEPNGQWRVVRTNGEVKVTPSWYLVEEPDEEDDSDDVRCCVCRSGRKPDSMLLCDGKDCQRGCHMHCLRPRLEVVPADTWLCPVCKFNRNLSEEDMKNVPPQMTLISLAGPALYAWRGEVFLNRMNFGRFVIMARPDQMRRLNRLKLPGNLQLKIPALFSRQSLNESFEVTDLMFLRPEEPAVEYKEDLYSILKGRKAYSTTTNVRGNRLYVGLPSMLPDVCIPRAERSGVLVCVFVDSDVSDSEQEEEEEREDDLQFMRGIRLGYHGFDSNTKMNMLTKYLVEGAGAQLVMDTKFADSKEAPIDIVMVDPRIVAEIPTKFRFIRELLMIHPNIRFVCDTLYIERCIKSRKMLEPLAEELLYGREGVLLLLTPDIFSEEDLLHRIEDILRPLKGVKGEGVRYRLRMNRETLSMLGLLSTLSQSAAKIYQSVHTEIRSGVLRWCSPEEEVPVDTMRDLSSLLTCAHNLSMLNREFRHVIVLSNDKELMATALRKRVSQRCNM
ncbi:hypothetical protein PROFUN_10998 [Planoprotostelium fungivorum]|uniref:PHD-type domain-containing protein n=1 Tax=Planoprotostelium fungivorum TaxID=1890364 RepID=A0A2P6NC03_9EUKA|nr:hypothetical protein PROFUN_10998 [Planoprotostelium fungivorum]